MSNPTDPDFAAYSRSFAGEYELLSELGRGGMGIVYLARDATGREVALKVLPRAVCDDPQLRERILREARTAARLEHPNIVRVHRADERAGCVFLSMARVDGETLAARVARRGPLEPREAAGVLRDAALALSYAHARGVVHRDVKPENILFDRDGRPLVTDFGIARAADAGPLTLNGHVLGTVHFMSPEQVSGEALDGRSDMYSLGVVGFYALSGRVPFDHPEATAVLVAHVNRPAPALSEVAPNVPTALARVVDRCLAKDPADRYPDCEQLAAALADVMTALPPR